MHPTPIVSNSVWAKLYQVAALFLESEIWEWMEESEIFGIQDPKTGEIGYCSFMELNDGEVPAIAIFRGTSGLREFEKTLKGEFSTSKAEFLAVQNFIRVEFVKKEGLDEVDLKVLKDLGLKVGKNAKIPLFRSYLPRYLPWYLNESEAQYLTLCLERALGFLDLYEEDFGLLDADDPEAILVDISTPAPSGPFWELHWKVPEVAPQQSFSPSLRSLGALGVNELQLRRIQKARYPVDPQHHWEMGCFATEAVIETQGRPRLGQVVILGDRQNEKMAFMGPVPLDATPAQAVSQVLLDRIDAHHFIPSRICVSDPELQKDLIPLARKLGTRVLFNKILPEISVMNFALEEDMIDEGFNNEDELGDWDEREINELPI